MNVCSYSYFLNTQQNMSNTVNKKKLIVFFRVFSVFRGTYNALKSRFLIVKICRFFLLFCKINYFAISAGTILLNFGSIRKLA